MPELPEVESLRRGLSQFILNQKILKVEVLYPKIVCGKGTKRFADYKKVEDFEKSLLHQEICKIDRRAKNLILHLKNKSILLVHLKMTGQLVYQPKKTSQKTIAGGHPIQLSTQSLPNKHTAIIFELEDSFLYYNDVRKFGYVLLFPGLDSLEEGKHFKNLGLEPIKIGDKTETQVLTHLEFTYQNFYKVVKSKKGVLKKVFLDQSVVVGLGNIYADEVCFAGGVLPNRKIESLKDQEIEKIYAEICRILPTAIEMGGSSVANYLLADGSKGNYAKKHKVYQKGGSECSVCQTILVKTQLAGRSTVHCPKCQK